MRRRSFAVVCVCVCASEWASVWMWARLSFLLHLMRQCTHVYSHIEHKASLLISFLCCCFNKGDAVPKERTKKEFGDSFFSSSFIWMEHIFSLSFDKVPSFSSRLAFIISSAIKMSPPLKAHSQYALWNNNNNNIK